MLPPRDVLYARIDARFDEMLEQGAMDEVKQLMSRQLDPSLPLMKALGVTALKAVLDQEMTIDEAAYIAKRDSRHYAKRQMTWLRNNYNAQIIINTKLSELLERVPTVSSIKLKTKTLASMVSKFSTYDFEYLSHSCRSSVFHFLNILSIFVKLIFLI